MSEAITSRFRRTTDTKRNSNSCILHTAIPVIDLFQLLSCSSHKPIDNPITPELAIMSTTTLVNFLKDELDLPTAEIRLALDHCDEPTNLPMVLWQYGIVSLSQLDQIFDWMFNSSATVR